MAPAVRLGLGAGLTRPHTHTPRHAAHHTGEANTTAVAGGGASDTLLSASALEQPLGRGAVARAFEVLTGRGSGEGPLAAQVEAAVRHEVEAVEALVEEAGAQRLALDRLRISLGPDLRATYPLVMNFGVAGELEVSGPAHPEAVAVRGVLRLPGGDVNLVATQLALDRDHANTITFEEGGSALDPVVDLVLSGGDLRVTIQAGSGAVALHYCLFPDAHMTPHPLGTGQGQRVAGAPGAALCRRQHGRRPRRGGRGRGAAGRCRRGAAV